MIRISDNIFVDGPAGGYCNTSEGIITLGVMEVVWDDHNPWPFNNNNIIIIIYAAALPGVTERKIYF